MHKKPPQQSTNADATRTVWLWLALVCMTLAVFTDRAWSEETDPPAVEGLTLVELYTSQGCSSCPPADTFLKDLAKRPDVLALSFHVDYWDTENWQDPFSSRSFSLRQRHYQDALATDYVYTPQVIVNGDFAVPGGQRTEILNEIENQSVQPHPPKLTVERRATGRIHITASESQSLDAGTLYVAVFNSSKVTRVRGGENRGRTLTNVNVVRRLIKLAPYDGKAASFNFSLRDLDADPADGVAVFVQTTTYGPVISVAAVMPKSTPETQVSMNAQKEIARR